MITLGGYCELRIVLLSRDIAHMDWRITCWAIAATILMPCPEVCLGVACKVSLFITRLDMYVSNKEWSLLLVSRLHIKAPPRNDLHKCYAGYECGCSMLYSRQPSGFN